MGCTRPMQPIQVLLDELAADDRGVSVELLDACYFVEFLEDTLGDARNAASLDMLRHAVASLHQELDAFRLGCHAGWQANYGDHDLYSRTLNVQPNAWHAGMETLDDGWNPRSYITGKARDVVESYHEPLDEQESMSPPKLFAAATMPAKPRHAPTMSSNQLTARRPLAELFNPPQPGVSPYEPDRSAHQYPLNGWGENYPPLSAKISVRPMITAHSLTMPKQRKGKAPAFNITATFDEPNSSDLPVKDVPDGLAHQTVKTCDPAMLSRETLRSHNRPHMETTEATWHPLAHSQMTVDTNGPSKVQALPRPLPPLPISFTGEALPGTARIDSAFADNALPSPALSLAGDNTSSDGESDITVLSGPDEDLLSDIGFDYQDESEDTSSIGVDPYCDVITSKALHERLEQSYYSEGAKKFRLGTLISRESDRTSLGLLDRLHTAVYTEIRGNPKYFRVMQDHEASMLRLACNVYLPNDIHHQSPTSFDLLSIHGDDTFLDYADNNSESSRSCSPLPNCICAGCSSGSPESCAVYVLSSSESIFGGRLRGGSATASQVPEPRTVSSRTVMVQEQEPGEFRLEAERFPLKFRGRVFATIEEFEDYCDSKPRPVTAWSNHFINSKGNEYFCDIDEEYLADRFNLTSLNTEVQYYQYAHDLVMDLFDLDCDDDMREQIEKAARHLYGLVHARYIVTTRGLQKMSEKFKTGEFGRCPRVACDGQPLLPMGQNDTANISPVKLYCGRCEDLYNPKSSRHATIDGAYFGTSFHSMFFQVYPNLMPPKSQKRYEPRVFGFRMHGAAALARWQNEVREEMKERLSQNGVETGYEVEDRELADLEGEMSEEEDENGGDRIDDMFEAPMVMTAAATAQAKGRLVGGVR